MEQDPPPEAKPALPLPVVTIVLAVLNIAAFVLSIAAGADPMDPTGEQIFDLGGNLGGATLDGDSWRLLTSMFLHFGLLHLVMNMVGLVDGGRNVERMYGKKAFVALYLFAGLVGSLASALAGTSVSAGASGAIFGIFGAWGAYLLLHREAIDKEALVKESRGLLIFFAFNIWFGLKTDGIDMRAHIGGLIAGFVAGLVLASGKQAMPRMLGVFVCCGLVIGAAHVLPAPEAITLLPSDYAKYQEFAKLEAKAVDRYNEIVTNDKVTQEERASSIDSEVLPVWRDGKKLVWSLKYLPRSLKTDLRAYIELREHTLTAMIAALRSKDEAALDAARKEMALSGSYVEKLKQ